MATRGKSRAEGVIEQIDDELKYLDDRFGKGKTWDSLVVKNLDERVVQLQERRKNLVERYRIK
jgi:hypothetical protein